VATDRAPLVLTAAQVALGAGGRLRQGPADLVVGGFSTDSRRVGAGQLFIALRGDRFDGGAFAEASLAAGACGVLVPPDTTVDAPASAVVIEADDTLLALQQLGQFVRRTSGARVVAITRYVVYRNAGNLNNHIGLPLSLLELTARPDIAVVELGMNHAGEISRLVELAEPDVRVWTNVGDAHIGHFASIDAIADAKAEILEGAGPATRLVANRDDARVMSRVGGFAGVTTTFGLQAGADVRATGVVDRGIAGTTARVETPAGSVAIEVKLPGRGPLLNVLAATAVAIGFDVPLDAIVERTASLTAAPRRGEVTRLARGVTLVDDSYNSSPAALAGALDAIGDERTAPRRVAVVGEMRELGEFADRLHAESGRRAAAAGIDLLVAVGGPHARRLADAAIAAGLPEPHVQYFATSEDAAGVVAGLLHAGDVVLVKGSRGTRTDVIADRIKEAWG
jgi:UDP-N-acetylmuramoyl-tripeptide--D-alanyl-D-alanine ligase